MTTQPWYCPNCGEPCDHDSGIHPGCQRAFGEAALDDKIEGDTPDYDHGVDSSPRYGTRYGPFDGVPAGDVDHDDEDRRAYREELNTRHRPSEY